MIEQENRKVSDPTPNVEHKKYFWGIIFILIGVVLILKILHLIPAGVADFLITWKMLLVVIGIANLIGGHLIGGTILIGVGAFFILPDIVHVSGVADQLYWPIGMILVGVWILTRHMNHRHFLGMRHHPHCVTYNSDPSFDQFDDFVFFGGKKQVFSSPAFKGGKVTCIFGGTEYNLIHSQPQKGGAIIDLFVLFGGMSLNVPPGWTIRNEITPVFGGFSDERKKYGPVAVPDPEKMIIIRGFAMFGGINIESKGYFL